MKILSQTERMPGIPWTFDSQTNPAIKNSMRESRKFFHRASNSDNVFLVDDGGDVLNTTKSGPSSKRRFADGPMMA